MLLNDTYFKEHLRVLLDSAIQEYLAEVYAGNRVEHVGDSLGGILADEVYAFLTEEEDYVPMTYDPEDDEHYYPR